MSKVADRVAYLDCPTGIAGDMCLGAIVDVGVPLAYLTEKLNRLKISGEYELHTEKAHRNGQQATKVHVLVHGEISDREIMTETHHSHSEVEATMAHHSEAGHTHAHFHDRRFRDRHHHEDKSHSHDKLRHLPEIEQMIRQADLPPRAEAWSLAIFRQLAEAEGAVHGISPNEVHFHEVGATDAIVDIVGTCLGLDWLEIDQLYCSALPMGGGTIRAAHGRLPVPVPAVLKLWEMRQVPIYHNGIDRELVTPTGAAIVTTLATRFGKPPAMTLQKVGLGAGSIDLPIPNLVRLWLGKVAADADADETDKGWKARVDQLSPSVESISVLETQIDDLNPQAIGYLFDALFEGGAVDVFTQAIGMKKSRPGVLLTVICPPEKTSDCENVLFRETSTLGIRHSTQQRSILDRVLQPIQTPYGVVQVKVASRNGTIVNVQPEYEDCARIARQHQLAWREVHRIALQNWYAQNSAH